MKIRAETLKWAYELQRIGIEVSSVNAGEILQRPWSAPLEVDRDHPLI